MVWFAVVTRPQLESRVYSRLRTMGVEACFPFFRKKVYRGRNRRMCWVDRPLFPRYLFARGLLNVLAVESLQETIGTVRAGVDVLTIDDSLIYSIIGHSQRLAEGDLVDSKGLPDYVVGTLVKLINVAPYFGREAEVLSVRNSSLEVAFKGFPRSVVVPKDAVAKILVA